MIHAMFWLLLITCYLLLATCYLTPVTCYLLVSTCYFLLNLFLLIWSWVFWSLLVLANRFLPFTTVVRLALVIIQFLLFSSVCLLVVARTLRPDWRKVGHPSNLNQSRIYGWQQYFGQTSRPLALVVNTFDPYAYKCFFLRPFNIISNKKWNR